MMFSWFFCSLCGRFMLFGVRIRSMRGKKRICHRCNDIGMDRKRRYGW